MHDESSGPEQYLPDLGGAPPWFEAALAQHPERTRLAVEGVELEVLAWGEAGLPPLLLLHGFSAHADWWSFTAPLLARRRRVVAFSFSGMGRSDWRESYSVSLHAREALAVAEAGGLFDGPQPPVFVGHSYGSFVARLASRTARRRLGGAVLVDGMPFDGSPVDDVVGRRRRVFPTPEAALARFRFSPHQACDNDYIVEYLARRSLARVTDERGQEGWAWCNDPDLLARTAIPPRDALIEPAACPVAIVFGERSAARTPELVQLVRRRTPHDAPWLVIPDAGHHVMADEPLALVDALAAVVAQWQDDQR